VKDLFVLIIVAIGCVVRGPMILFAFEIGRRYAEWRWLPSIRWTTRTFLSASCTSYCSSVPTDISEAQG
jgi:hypothetical protein